MDCCRGRWIHKTAGELTDIRTYTRAATVLKRHNTPN